MSGIAALWPDDELVSAAGGATYNMATGHQYHVSGTLAAIQPDITQVGRVEITRFILDHPVGEKVVISTYNLPEIMNRRRKPMREKAHALLREIVSELHGKPGVLNWTLSPHAKGYCDILRRVGLDLGDEIHFVLQYLEQTRSIELGKTLDPTDVKITLPVTGLVIFEEDEAEVASSQNAFVAMWFNEEMTAAFEKAIVPAIEQWGYTAVRIDRQEYNDKIDDRIISEIRRARFVVADFSCDSEGARGGVYFEAGFAAGLGIPVIFTVREPDLKRVHFDTRQYNHIVWKDAEELRVALENRIGATIGEYRR